MISQQQPPTTKTQKQRQNFSSMFKAVFVAAVAMASSATAAFVSPSFTTTTTTTRHHSSNNKHSFFSLKSSTTATTNENDGLIKTITKQGTGKVANLGDIATIKYSCYLPDDEKAIPFSRSEKQKMVIGDGSMIPGWDKALRTMTVGERAIVRLTDPQLGYGEVGVPPFVPPNSQLELDIELLDSQPATANIDFDSLATADNTPRTAADIQAAYEQRQAMKALEGPEKEGLEGFIEKAKNFYFFGFFEGETGQQAPWILRPSITFPIAFAIVGLAFYVSYLAGAISEKGAESTDELDEIILSSDAIINTFPAVVMSMVTTTTTTAPPM